MTKQVLESPQAAAAPATSLGDLFRQFHQAPGDGRDLEQVLAARIQDNLAWAAEHGGPTAGDVAFDARLQEGLRQCWSQPDESFVNSVYRLVLGRKIDATAREATLAFLAGGGQREDLVWRIICSPESGLDPDNSLWLHTLDCFAPQRMLVTIRRLLSRPDREFVRGLYACLLRRFPTGDELQAWLRRLEAGLTGVGLVGELAGMAEGLDPTWLEGLEQYTAEGVRRQLREIWHLPDELFVRQVYLILLNRPPEAEGLAMYTQHLQRGLPRVALLRGVMESPEYSGQRVARDWQTFRDGLSPGWVWDRLVCLWPLPAREFIAGAYRLLLGREPAALEQQKALERLADGLARADLVRCLSETAEFRSQPLDTSWLARLPPAGATESPEVLHLLALPDRGQFVRHAYRLLLGRDATEAEVRLQARLLRFVPFYSRRALVRRLRRRGDPSCAS
jgi:hypothetical protein